MPGRNINGSAISEANIFFYYNKKKKTEAELWWGGGDKLFSLETKTKYVESL